MLQLNADSWFVRKFLGCTNARSLPKGICDLFWLFVGRTLMFLLIISVTLLLLASIVNAVRFGYDIGALTDFYGSNELAHMSVAASLLTYIVLTVWIIIYFFGKKIDAWVINRQTVYFADLVEMQNKKWDSAISVEEYNEWYANSKYNKGWFKTTCQVIAALWKRVHDKTCVMIDWKIKP